MKQMWNLRILSYFFFYILNFKICYWIIIKHWNICVYIFLKRNERNLFLEELRHCNMFVKYLQRKPVKYYSTTLSYPLKQPIVYAAK